MAGISVGKVLNLNCCHNLYLEKFFPGEYEYTIYSSCMNQEKGIYYYTTYGNPEVHAVDMHKTDLDGKELTSYKLQKDLQFHFDN
nr:linear amide C-N hydrolase [Lactobacillus delbrueckii]